MFCKGKYVATYILYMNRLLHIMNIYVFIQLLIISYDILNN